jgi:hypothetical protein
MLETHVKLFVREETTMRFDRYRRVILVSAFIIFGLVQPHFAQDAATGKTLGDLRLPFYIYQSFGARENHFVPSGWMGDYGDIRFSDKFKDQSTGGTVIQVTYSAQAKQGNGWAGIYWQNPANNWGSKSGGFNLNGAKKLVFRARGDKGGETVSQFKVGGITGAYADSGSAAIGPITLAKEWKEYEIDLVGQELSSISGGFCWTMTRDENPEGSVIYLDDIRYE